MGLDLGYTHGQTPIDEDDIEGLLIRTIATKGELDEYEQQNIEQAIQWILKSSFSVNKIFSELFTKQVHRKMYGDVWKWAGEFRKTNKNIGIDKTQIATQLNTLLGDVKYWIDNKTFPADEIAIRYKHRLVSIHCFPNGNGRHSRLMADIVIEKIFKLPVFTWGARNLINQGDPRSDYLSALKAADAGNI